MDFTELIEYYSSQFDMINSKAGKADGEMPGGAYFIEDGSILCIPRSDGDNRFPYGENGFNFWTYASGYMHANDGLFSPFLRANEGQEPKIAFFAGWKQKDTYDVLSLLAVPKLEETSFPELIRFTVFTKTATYYITKTKEARFALRVFVDTANHMYFSLIVKNLNKLSQKLYISTYFNPYLCNSIHESSENRWFRQAEFMEEVKKEYSHFVFRINEDLSRTLSVTNFGVINRSIILQEDVRLIGQEATTSRYQYVGGALSSLHSPQALKQGFFSEVRHTTTFNEVAVAGEILKLDVATAKCARIDIEVSYKIHKKNPEGFRELIRNIDPAQIDELVHKIELKNDMENRSLRGTFGEAVMEPYDGKIQTYFLDYLKKQVEFCSKIKGYVQLSEGSLIGIRDVFQAIEGMLFYRPEEAREKMLEALGFTFPNGRCPRQYSLPVNEQQPPVMDLRQFIDQGVWVINAVITYLKFTGDFDFLRQSCGYYEIVDEMNKIVKSSDLKEDVLSHMLRIMDYLIQNQDPVTGCIRTLYGDWNDALDGLGVSRNAAEEFGSGVSVMATLQVYQNLCDMTELLQYLGVCNKKAGFYQSKSEKIEKALIKHAIIRNDAGEKRIVHGLGDQQTYYVGSFKDPDGKSRVGLTSNAFWVISGMYKTDMSIKEVIISAFDQLDSVYGLKTFEPHFEPNTPGVGRIYKLPPGTAENGAVYIHAAAFGIMALFMMGESKRAWDQMTKIFPFTHRCVSCSPYVMPNSYGENKALNIDGESMLDWQTGSSNVVFKIIIRFIFGFQPEYQGFYLQPAAWMPFWEYQLDITYRGAALQIKYQNKMTGRRSFTVNKNSRSGIYDVNMGIDKLWIDKQEVGEGFEILIED